MVNLENILCPIDYSEYSKEALKYAASFAMKDKAKLYLLHVTDIRAFEQNLDVMAKQINDEMIKQHKSRLLDYIPEKMKNDIEVEVLVNQGIPVDEIIDVSKEKKIDMIVMGSRGRTGIAHIMLGSVAENVARKAPCPVLIAKQPRR
ncbi:MAG: universal stress protein [Candidatus Scalindua sp. AMX11]|nr:MAG: universal stress protein [Candidatus Scalindua sp.]NOG83055.1 universal stress protein [Planctomycetota bacterium]RZV79548.1 MAG: universal stress protein [Candidatus Scalindua sp. SCAELEC01]TDE65185.1 MAG: universal stress protein [Candidatus Scalindua sp. AMX11]GJQ58580.1 MAG: universal stress protein [Candidatus Scalindua sp.]